MPVVAGRLVLWWRKNWSNCLSADFENYVFDLVDLHLFVSVLFIVAILCWAFQIDENIFFFLCIFCWVFWDPLGAMFSSWVLLRATTKPQLVGRRLAEGSIDIVADRWKQLEEYWGNSVSDLSKNPKFSMQSGPNKPFWYAKHCVCYATSFLCCLTRVYEVNWMSLGSTGKIIDLRFCQTKLSTTLTLKRSFTINFVAIYYKRKLINSVSALLPFPAIFFAFRNSLRRCWMVSSTQKFSAQLNNFLCTENY